MMFSRRCSERGIPLSLTSPGLGASPNCLARLPPSTSSVYLIWVHFTPIRFAPSFVGTGLWRKPGATFILYLNISGE